MFLQKLVSIPYGEARLQSAAFKGIHRLDRQSKTQLLVGKRFSNGEIVFGGRLDSISGAKLMDNVLNCVLPCW